MESLMLIFSFLRTKGCSCIPNQSQSCFFLRVSITLFNRFISFGPIHKTAGSGTAMDQAIDLVMAPNGYHIISYCCPLCLH